MIKDLKELKELLSLCRKQGVLEIKLGDCYIKLGELPRKEVETPKNDAVTGELTEEQLMYYSVEGA